jgi:phenylacetate-CoA ligase
MPDGRLWSDDLVLHAPRWTYVGQVFETGPYVAFSNMNPIERQVEFLRVEAPDYLTMQAAALEHVALAGNGSPRLRACLATSQTLTAPMRANIERALGVPVHQNYGFNEIGLVASRCPEGGRYHVHAEHCLVEIVDPDGRGARAGERGRILVTSLTNRTMPLLRYDCDDFATAVDGPCPCGRTLPSFGEIHGRYRRIAPLPRGSWQRWGAIQYALSELPPDLAPALRRYQAHEYADRWVLRIHATDGKAEAIGACVRVLFERVAADPPPLEIVATDRFEGRPDAKFQDFLSDFVEAS